PSVLRPHPAPTALSPLSLHDALPIFPVAPHCTADGGGGGWWLGLGSSTPAAPSGPSPEPKPKARRRAPARLEGGRGGGGNRTTGVAGGACRRPPAGSAPRPSGPPEHPDICEAARGRGEVGRGGRPSLGRRDRARRPRPGPGGGMSLTLLEGDCRAMLPTLPAESVQCVVTSPPYWGLRDYGTASWEG